MRVDVVTLVPAMFDSWLRHGVVSRAIEAGIVSVTFTDLRRFGLGRHLQVDDYPFGGGAGMVLKPEPLFAAVESLTLEPETPVILMSARGRLFDQETARQLASSDRLTLICGHYEGVDERVAEHLATIELSIGDYILSGGELPAMVVIDAVTRLLPSAIDEESTREESFESGLLEYPQYTRPAEFRGWSVPPVLLSGHHAEIARWRAAEALARTRLARPDLLHKKNPAPAARRVEPK